MKDKQQMKNNQSLSKICLIASAGGHLSQLLELSESWKNRNVFYIVTSDLVRKKIESFGRVYTVGECNRRHLWDTLRVLNRCINILLREKPKVIISTGAAAGCLGCFLGKLLGSKIIWIDSITNVEKLSLSGRIVRYIADLFFVQWPDLTKKYKHVEFAGELV